MKKIVPEYVFSAEQLNTVKRLAAECGLLEDTVKILYGRGIDDKDKILRFIHPSRSHFISPFKMGGMDKAVELITRARDEGWSVAVYGDYDADGICASTIMYFALKDFGIEPYVYVPERKSGYGLSVAAIDEIFEQCFPQLFITVDCGISCAEQVEYIKEQGAEVIVTDHHELPDVIPDCICINPKFNDGYIYDNLCGAGVALKVAVALNGDESYKYLDFATIATVADSVPLTGENRDIVYEGLKLINSHPRDSYAPFLNKNDIVTAHTISFNIAPKINAAGRMGDVASVLKLFTSTDKNVIFDLSAKIMAYNTERQTRCDELLTDAKRKLKEQGAYDKVIMLWDEDWNTGFVGIVAAKLAEECTRPTLLFVRNGDVLKGSARSVDAINIFEALKANSQYIKEFGGHSQAAGVTIPIENFGALQAALNDYLSSHYSDEDFEHSVVVSGVLKSAYSQRFAKEISMLEPFGVGNKKPLFAVEEEAAKTRILKPMSPHLSIRSDKIELMFFGGAKYGYLIESPAPKSFIFEYSVSLFRGREYVKGLVRDVIPSPDAGAYCGEDIAINNVLTLANNAVDCNITLSTCAEIDKNMATGSYGTLYIASDYATLSRYKNISRLQVELFTMSAGNYTDVVIVSPRADSDFSGFEKIVFLDSLPAGVRIPSIEGKDVTVCSDVCGYNYIKQLDAERDTLLKIFARALSNATNIQGGDSGEVAANNDLGASALQTVFALEVFRQLSLIDYSNFHFRLFRGIKTDLANSELYNIVKNAKF